MRQIGFWQRYYKSTQNEKVINLEGEVEMKDKSLTRVSVFLTSQIISLFGSAIVSYSIVWYITLKTSSTMALAISIVCTYMPQIVISMFSGTWGDKFNKKNLIIIGDTITGISTLILAILFINGFDSLYLLYGACALRSVGSGIQTPLEHAFLPLICPEEKLTKINGIYATASSAINILSPAMAGVLLNVMDFGHTLFIDCITALLAIIVLLKLKYKNTISSNKDTSTLSDFLEGVKYFKQHIFLGRLILFYLLFYFFMSAPAFLTPVLVNLKFSSSVNALAINEFVWSLGTMLGGILICSFKEFNKLKFMAISALLFGGFICLLGASNIFSIYILFMLCSGISLPLFNTSNTVLIQENVKKEMLGRVFANLNILSTISTTIGITVFGIIGNTISVDILLILVGAFIAILSIWIWKIYRENKV